METLERENAVAVQPQAVTPMTLVSMAVQQGADIDKLEKLMALQERWEANEARKAFVVALSAFKAEPPELIKDKHVAYKNKSGDLTEYDHPSLDQVSVNIGKALSKQGLSHRWDVEQKDGIIRVTCVLTHSMGHSERVPMEGSPDESGGKNKIQAIGSTVTYLQRYTLLAATGMAVKDQDDDGRQAEGLPQDQFGEFEKRIRAAIKKDAAKAIWQEAVKACAVLKDVESANRLKDILLEHGKFIDQADKAA